MNASLGVPLCKLWPAFAGILEIARSDPLDRINMRLEYIVQASHGEKRRDLNCHASVTAPA